MPGADRGDPPPEVRDLLRTGLLCLLVTLAAALAFFGPGLFTGSKLFFTHELYASDFWHMNYPLRSFYADGLAEGRLPLWCPDLGLGYPVLADGQVGALYPVNLLLYSVLPLAVALNWEILLHLVLAGAFAGMFARQMGAGRAGSALAAVVYGLSGFFLVHLKHANMIVAGAYFPLILLLMERYAASRRRATLALLSVAIGASALGGHPQVVYYDLLLAAFYAVWLLVRMRRRSAVRLGAGLAVATVLGLLLAAPQILPALELKGLSPREGGLSAEDATRWDVDLEDLGGFVRPMLHGDPGELQRVPVLHPETGAPSRDPLTGVPIERLRGFETPGRDMLFWEMTAYVGLLPLLFAFLALLLARPRAPAAALAALLVLSVVLALGPGAGLFTVFRSVVPGFDLFRFAGRFLLYTDFALAVLAGLGLTAVVRRLTRPVPRLARAAPPVVLVLAVLDLSLALGDHNPQVEAKEWLRPPPVVERIRSEEGEGGTPFRIATIDPDRWVFRNAYRQARGWKGDLSPYVPAFDTLDPNLSLLHGIDNAFHHSPLAVEWVTDVTHMLFLPPAREGGLTTGVDPLVASLLNVRYLVDPFDVLGGQIEPLAEFPGGILLPLRLGTAEGRPFTIRLRRNPLELPRAFLVPRARFVDEGIARPEGMSAAEAALLARDFDPRAVVLISGGEPLGADGAAAPAGPIDRAVEFLEYTPHRVRLRAEARDDCWLFLSDTYYPGWVAEVDGKETEIRRANVAGRAIRLSSGPHEIVFSYRPAPFRWGLGGMTLALAALAAMVLPRRRRDSRNSPAAGSG